MTTVNDILICLEQFAPYNLAEAWDNCGLLVGDRTQAVTRVLCALDATEAVLHEAHAYGAQVIVTHHPVIFTSVSQVTTDDTTGRILHFAIQNNISIICMHTNADCTWGGVNDALATVLGLKDIVNMEAGDNKMLGRVGNLPTAMEITHFVRYVQTTLHADGVRFVDGCQNIRRVAVGGGACGKMMDAAIAKQADAFVIGDSSYDLMQRAKSLGLTLVDAGHFPTENPVVRVFAHRINHAFPDLIVSCSDIHADCIHFI